MWYAVLRHTTFFARREPNMPPENSSLYTDDFLLHEFI